MKRNRLMYPLLLAVVYFLSATGLKAQISTFPYIEGFENSNAGWSAAWIAPSGIPKISWVRATPANPVINSAANGTKCWITGNSSLTQFKYFANEYSAVLSPYFDFSALVNPYISMNVFWETDYSWDGAVLQATVDSGATWVRVGKAGDPVNWYNDNSINGNSYGGPGGQLHGWTGNFTPIGANTASNGSQGWVNAQHSLKFLAGQPSVRFRVAFASDGSGEDDGFAFDDVLITDLPILDLGPDTTLCFADTLILNACLPTATKYEWNTSVIDTFCTKVAVKTDIYIIKVTDTLGFTLRDTISVFVSSTNAALGPDQLICPGDTVTLIPAKPGPTRLWFPSLSTGTQQKVWETGVYKFQTSDQYGCTEVDSVNIAVDFVPVVELGNDTLICNGSTVILDAGAGNPGTSYNWNIPGATTQTFYISAPGTYWVDVTTAAGCKESDTIDVNVSLAPVVNLGPDFTACEPFTLDANNPGALFKWSTGATTKSITTFVPGTYFVTVTNQFGCVASDTITVQIGSIPSVSLGPDKVVCNGSSVTLNLANQGSTYFWSTGATTQTISVKDGGTYIGTVTNAAGCSRSDTIEVIESPLFVNLGPDLTICNGDSTLLDAGVTGSSYLWSTGATTAQVWVTTGGNYVVEATDFGGNCSAKDTIVINAVPNFNASITVPDSGIIYQAVQFNDLSGAVANSWLWTFGDGNSSTLKNPVYTYNAVGDFDVCLKVSDGICVNTVCDKIFIDIFTDIDDELDLNLSIAPNPASDQISISLEMLDVAQVELSISDLSGRIVHQQDLGVTRQSLTAVPVSEWATGLYFVKLNIGNAVIYRKLFVQ
ncbi:MAG: PKD domain-containing protein [Bacteroidia bacterium]|nr:PKD domain-containing protein [Bacteroidia bacterium]